MSNGIVTFSQLGRYGRFANGVFQVMSTIGIARRNGMDFKFPLWQNIDHKERFGSTEDIDIYNHLKHELPLWTGEQYPQRFVQWGYEDFALNGNTDIVGHLQSDKYFSHCMDEVRHWLTFKNEPRPCEQHVAIHYRAGDYEKGGRSVYHPRCSEEYYKQALQYFPKETTFLLFSDNIVEALTILRPLAKYIIVADSGCYITDFINMKSCHSFICANSSYSLAAAILANQPGKKIICPSLWFGDPAGGLKMDYPENAIII